MRILCRYIPPAMGSALGAGYDIIDQSLEVRRRVGYVPETIPLYPDMSGFEHLKFMVVITMFMLKVNH
jgi:ABC-2 type transport system ATP-binding protein